MTKSQKSLLKTVHKKGYELKKRFHQITEGKLVIYHVRLDFMVSGPDAEKLAKMLIMEISYTQDTKGEEQVLFLKIPDLLAMGHFISKFGGVCTFDLTLADEEHLKNPIFNQQPKWN